LRGDEVIDVGALDGAMQTFDRVGAEIISHQRSVGEARSDGESRLIKAPLLYCERNS
jgi:hypothetical protein